MSVAKYLEKLAAGVENPTGEQLEYEIGLIIKEAMQHKDDEFTKLLEALVLQKQAVDPISMMFAVPGALAAGSYALKKGVPALRRAINPSINEFRNLLRPGTGSQARYKFLQGLHRSGKIKPHELDELNDLAAEGGFFKNYRFSPMGTPEAHNIDPADLIKKMKGTTSASGKPNKPMSPREEALLKHHLSGMTPEQIKNLGAIKPQKQKNIGEQLIEMGKAHPFGAAGAGAGAGLVLTKAFLDDDGRGRW